MAKRRNIKKFKGCILMTILSFNLSRKEDTCLKMELNSTLILYAKEQTP